MSETYDEGNDYEIGYRRPPAAHRFQKGRSGNPSGAKRKNGKVNPKNLRAEVINELGQRVAVTENGRRRQIPRQTAFAKKLVADALNGDAKARDQLIKLANQADAHQDAVGSEDLIGAAKDAEILERFRAEIIAKYKEAEDE